MVSALVPGRAVGFYWSEVVERAGTMQAIPLDHIIPGHLRAHFPCRGRLGVIGYAFYGWTMCVRVRSHGVLAEWRLFHP